MLSSGKISTGDWYPLDLSMNSNSTSSKEPVSTVQPLTHHGRLQQPTTEPVNLSKKRYMISNSDDASDNQKKVRLREKVDLEKGDTRCNSQPLDKRAELLQRILKPQMVIAMTDAVSNPVQVVKLTDESMQTMSSTIFSLLVQTVHRVLCISSIGDILHEEITHLITKSWHRLLLWLCANENIEFKVTPVTEAELPAGHGIVSPTLSFVKNVSTFIKRYQELEIDKEELKLLFAITVFQSGTSCAEPLRAINRQRKELMEQLRDYEDKKEKGSQRFSQLLLALPLLYGIHEKMFERLFCGNFLNGMSIDFLIAEILHYLIQKDNITEYY